MSSLGGDNKQSYLDFKSIQFSFIIKSVFYSTHNLIDYRL